MSIMHTASQTPHPQVYSVHVVSITLQWSLAVIDLISSHTAQQCLAFIPAGCAAVAMQCLLVSLVHVAVP